MIDFVAKPDPFRLSYADPQLLAGDFKPLQSTPYDSARDDLIGQDISTVDPLAGVQPYAAPPIPTQNIVNDLAYLRAEMPFLAITRIPTSFRTVYLNTASLAVDIDVPAEAALVSIWGSAAEFWVSVGGRAEVPGATLNVETASMFGPAMASQWWYVGGHRQMSVISPYAGAVVQLAFINRK